MTVYRPDPLQFEEIEIEIKKKSGKPFGISFMAPLRGPGVYVNELVRFQNKLIFKKFIRLIILQTIL